MRRTNEFFIRCQVLNGLCFDLKFDPGIRVARGYADFGFEEFLVLPGEKLLSLCTGAITPVDESRVEHIFLIPTIDDFIEQLERRNVCPKISYDDNRNWKVEFESPEGSSISCKDRDLNFSLLSALEELCKKAINE